MITFVLRESLYTKLHTTWNLFFSIGKLFYIQVLINMIFFPSFSVIHKKKQLTKHYFPSFLSVSPIHLVIIHTTYIVFFYLSSFLHLGSEKTQYFSPSLTVTHKKTFFSHSFPFFVSFSPPHCTRISLCLFLYILSPSTCDLFLPWVSLKNKLPYTLYYFLPFLLFFLKLDLLERFIFPFLVCFPTKKFRLQYVSLFFLYVCLSTS